MCRGGVVDLGLERVCIRVTTREKRSKYIAKHNSVLLQPAPDIAVDLAHFVRLSGRFGTRSDNLLNNKNGQMPEEREDDGTYAYVSHTRSWSP